MIDDNNPLENQLTLKKKFIVTSADTDMFGRLKLSVLANFLIQSAISSADKLGFGLKYLREEKLFWVLHRLTIKIEKQLKWYDEIEVETWPKTVEGLLYIRDFIVRDKKKNIVARGTSAWLAIDLIRKRPKIIGGIITDIFHSLKHKNAIEELPSKLSLMKDGETNEINTSFFDLDLNQHVTSTRYIDWIMDAFSVDFHSKNYPKSLSINYLIEVKPNEKIQISKNKINKQSFHFEGLNLTTGKQTYRSELIFNTQIKTHE